MLADLDLADLAEIEGTTRMQVHDQLCSTVVRRPRVLHSLSVVKQTATLYAHDSICACTCATNPRPA